MADETAAKTGGAVTCSGWVVETPVSSWYATAMELVPDLVVPAPQATQVRVRVRAAGVNPVDWRRVSMPSSPKKPNALAETLQASLGGEANKSGSQGSPKKGKPRRVSALTCPFPHVPGLDGAGEVESVGSAVTEFKAGDRVLFHSAMTDTFGGTFCEYALVEQDVLVPIPTNGKARPNIAFEEAAALPCASWTAYLALFDKLRVEAGRSILISGGSGGVGSTAVQLAHHFGLYVIATCSTPHVRYVQQLGADLVLDYTSVDVVAETLRRTAGFGVDYLLEAAGAALAEPHAEALRFGGALCVLTGTVHPSSDVFFYRQLSVHYVFLGMLHGEPLVRPQLRRIGEEVLRLYADGAFRVYLEKVPFTRANEALDVAYHCHTLGKLVLTNFHQM